MELGSKVTALEEEIGVLKGEIKTILQEVRTAVLARQNPFSVDYSENLPVPALAQVPPPSAEPPTAAETPPSEAPPSEVPPSEALPSEVPSNVVQLKSAAGVALQEIPPATPFQGRDETDAPHAINRDPQARQRWSVGSLATLIAWTQETADRMDASDLDIVLSLARYGGLIDEELESTLTKLSAPLFQDDSQPRPSGVTNYLLALRELSALIDEADDSYGASRPLRRVS